jgi:addiction module RelE/StbE family toxin
VYYKIQKNVLKRLKKIKKSDPELYKKILIKIEIFYQNEKHPSLRVHKLQGELGDYWSLSINRGVRIIYFIEDNKACFVNIGTHDEVYRMN